MSSIFRQRIEQRAEEAISLNPSVQTGWAIRTSDVLGDEMNSNPWFLSLNGMSFDESRALLTKDTVQSGISYMTREPGVSRNERVFVNPKPTSTINFGGNTGKEAVSLLGTRVALGDMVFSGSNNNIPTIIGISLYSKPQDSTQSVPIDIKDNSSFNGEIPPVRISGLNTDEGDIGISTRDTSINSSSSPSTTLDKRGNTTRTETTISPLPPLLDQSGKIIPQDTTRVNIYGSGIRTGTLLLENSELSSLSAGNFSEGINF